MYRKIYPELVISLLCAIIIGLGSWVFYAHACLAEYGEKLRNHSEQLRVISAMAADIQMIKTKVIIIESRQKEMYGGVDRIHSSDNSNRVVARHLK